MKTKFDIADILLAHAYVLELLLEKKKGGEILETQYQTPSEFVNRLVQYLENGRC